MPVRQVAPARSGRHDQYVADLASEWKRPDGQKTEPIIFEEKDLAGRIAHVYVIWSRWADTERVGRSEIIMESAEQALTPVEVSNITTARGLTPDEASRMGMVS